jgi:hypothetical protein
MGLAVAAIPPGILSGIASRRSRAAVIASMESAYAATARDAPPASHSLLQLGELEFELLPSLPSLGTSTRSMCARLGLSNIQPQRCGSGARSQSLSTLAIEAASIPGGISPGMPGLSRPHRGEVVRDHLSVAAGARDGPNAAGGPPDLIRNPIDQPRAPSSC